MRSSSKAVIILLGALAALVAEVAFAKSEVSLIRREAVVGSIQRSAPVIPAGRRATVRTFGGAAPSGALIVLEWGSGSSWQLVRAGTGTFDLKLNRDFIGDGSKQFRVTVEGSGTSVFWLDALLH